MITYSNLLLLYAQRGFFNGLRKSAFRKFCKRNIGQRITAKCRSGFLMNTAIGDSVDNKIAVYGIFEAGTTHVVERLAMESSSFLDIGCNIGYYSCLFGSKNPGRPLLAVDPNPAMIARTQENLNLNHIVNYELINCGIGERRATLTLNIPRFRHSLSSFAYVPSKGGPSTAIEAEILPLHEVIRERPTLDASLVKIDAEGFEYQIFCGLSEEVIDKINFVLFELSTANLRRAGKSPADIFSLPVMKAFDVYIVKDGDGGFIDNADPARMQTVAEIDVNVLLVRKDPAAQKALQRAAICRRCA
jgi:FkbM family methyltransferase